MGKGRYRGLQGNGRGNIPMRQCVCVRNRQPYIFCVEQDTGFLRARANSLCHNIHLVCRYVLRMVGNVYEHEAPNSIGTTQSG